MGSSRVLVLVWRIGHLGGIQHHFVVIPNAPACRRRRPPPRVRVAGPIGGEEPSTVVVLLLGRVVLHFKRRINGSSRRRGAIDIAAGAGLREPCRRRRRKAMRQMRGGKREVDGTDWVQGGVKARDVGVQGAAATSFVQVKGRDVWDTVTE